MNWSLVRAIVILPGTVLVYVPALILWAADGTELTAVSVGVREPRMWLTVLLGLAGFGLAISTVRLLMIVGEGTPAPWNPPRKLVVRGPYRHVRNPMITSVLMMLSAETLATELWPLVAWLVFFFVANCVYFPLVEEKGLERRFGDAYRTYKANVPRWLPRITPWQQP